jgi:hypothetical protein
MTRKSLVCRLLRQVRPQRAVIRSEGLSVQTEQAEQTEQAVRYGNPFAEILWPTLPEIPAGPFHHWHLYNIVAR